MLSSLHIENIALISRVEMDIGTQASKNAFDIKNLTSELHDDYYNKNEVHEYVSTQTAVLESDMGGLANDILYESHFKGYVLTNADVKAIVPVTPNDFAYSAESNTKWVYEVVGGWTDTGITVPDQLTPASNTTPLINGTASVGVEEMYARGDHRHPTDTTRLSVEVFNTFKTELESSLDNIISKHGLGGVDV